MTPGDIVLSPEQNAAILTPGNLLVRAGAGSGKTEVLARRFVALIAGEIDGREPVGPEQVAAITFTEKAALDMKARIMEVLERRIDEEAAGERRTHLLRARRLLPLARISTIHGFCARILREQSLEAALDPDFQVLDEYESRTLLERICKQALVSAVRNGDAGAAYLARTYRLSRRLPIEGALEIVLRLLDELAQLGNSPEWLEQVTRQAATRLETEPARLAAMAAELVHLLDELLNIRSLTPKAAERIARLRSYYDEYRRQILAINPQVDPEALGFLRGICELIPDAKGKIKDCVSSIKRIVKNDQSAFGLTGELIASYGACRAAARANAVARTISMVAAKLKDAKAEQRVLTFDDLLLRTRELLRNNASTVHHYRTGIRALLIDEYQDTNAVQHEIISQLAGSAKDGSRTELFIVGDEKQSIYRFRGADVTVFNRARQELSCEVPLLGNRRSTPGIVTFVNRLGAHLMRPAEPAAQPYWIEWGQQHELSTLRERFLDAPVEIITAISDASDSPGTEQGDTQEFPPNAAARRTREGRAIATRIAQIVDHEIIEPKTGDARFIRYGDIAILLRAFTDVAIYENALLDAGIPCYTVKGRGFFGCQEVLDLVELLTAVNAPDDAMAVTAALRSPFFGVSDACLAEIALRHLRASDDNRSQWGGSIAASFAASVPDFEWLSEGREDALHAWRILKELRELRNSGAIIDVIEHALEATSYEAVMLGLRQGRQRLANVRKLVELARQFESRQLFTFHDFVVHLRQLIEQEPYEPQAQILGEDEDVVRLMTVHQAKGLEFPVVILADAGRRPNNDNRNPVVDPENGLVLRDVSGSGMDQLPSRLLDGFRKRNATEQEAESIRLLYVALTRARDRLIISEGLAVQGWARQLREFVGPEIIASFVQSAEEQKSIERTGAKIVLRRPQATIPARVEAPFADRAANRLDKFVWRLEFQPPGRIELVLSPTALADFDRCPRQFNFRHILQIPEPPFGFTNGDANAPDMGIVAHAVIERLDLGVRRPNENEIRRIAELVGVSAGLNPQQCSAIAADLIRYAAVIEESPAAREIPFFCHVGESMFIQGRIDALIERDGLAVIRDYKYAYASEPAAYQVQMEAYALAAAALNCEGGIAAEIVFLRDGCVTPVSLPPVPLIRARMLALGQEIAEAQNTGEYRKKPAHQKICRQLGCGFVSRCWQTG